MAPKVSPAKRKCRVEDFDSEEKYRSHREKQNKNYRKWRKNTKEALSVLREENPQLKEALSDLKQENSQMKDLLKSIANMLTTNIQDQSQQVQRDNQIREKIANMIDVNTIIYQDVTATVNNTDIPSSMTDRVNEEEFILQIFEEMGNVNKIPDQNVSANMDKDAPSYVMNMINEQEVALPMFSYSWDQEVSECSLAGNMTLMSNNSNAIIQENNEEDFCIDDLPHIPDCNEIITTLDLTELFDLLK